MQFGHFDDLRKEYVITNPATPKSWSNYLGSTEYGAIITNNAGGYSFYKSGGMGRFMRMRFNSVPMDQAGRYIYLRDDEDGDFWSASWQPVGKPLEEFKSECRHGTAYSIITSEYKKIKTETTYFVPLGKTYEVWKLKIKNDDTKVRKLKAFTYVEYSGTWNAIDDLLNIQYVQYTAQMNVIDGIIDHGTNVHIPAMPDNFKEKDQGRHTFQALVGAEVKGYDTDREVFLGNYRTYANPIAVEKGECKNSLGYGDNPCGTLQTELELKPGEEKTILVLVGIGAADKEGKAAAAEYENELLVDEQLEDVKKYWHERLKGFSALTPDEELNSTINTWGIYNSLITFAWSRAASLIYSGIDRDGLGYRDTVQDFVGVTHAITDEVRERLELMITGQTSTGGAMPVVQPISHKPGGELLPKEEQYRSDDSLWLFNAIPAYVKESGDLDFYKKNLPYSDKGEGSIFNHMKRAIEFSLERSGAHGLPCGLAADWNDCLRFGHNGESVFVAMQLRLALAVYIEVAQLLGDNIEEQWGSKNLKTLDENIQSYAWDGEWFMRGYRYDGMKFGSKDVPEGQIFLNPQAWSVISGAASKEQGCKAMAKVKERLSTDYGIMVCDPPYTSSDYNIVRAQLMNPGLKENGGIFVHTQGWGVMAETILGNGNQAYEYLRAYLPAAYNQKAEIREIEPYVVCQSTHAKYSPKHGASRVPWLSGSATWTYYSITQYVLGIRPEYNGLTIDPCIPSDWKGFTAERKFRNKIFRITVDNASGVEKGVTKIIFNGTELESNFIPVQKMKEENEVAVIMG
ncbi:MAG: N,N'-diacetylchitobiose phosphorylase [Melioribacteraceae bacterium]|nr:N,N'-diacetylchitobiose phosphorylase [Melioribacteraceae bacterium]